MTFKKRTGFSFRTALIVALMFGAIGAYLLFRIFADTGAVLSVDNFVASSSVNAGIVTEYRPLTTNNITIVKVNPGTNSHATFVSNTTNLDPAQYKACLIGYAPDNTVTGKVSISQYSGGPVGTPTIKSFSLATALDYTLFRCVPFTVLTKTPGSQIIVSNTSKYSLRVSLIFIKKTGEISAPTATLTASPSTVIKGSSSTLTWESSNTTSCLASGAWSGSKPLAGSFNTGAVNADAQYILTCSGASGNTTSVATVKVTDPPPILPSGSFVGVGTYSSNIIPKIADLGVKDIRVENPAGTNVGSPSLAWYKAAKASGLTILPQLNYNYWCDTGAQCDSRGHVTDEGHSGVPAQYANTWAKREVDLVYGAASGAGAPKPQALEVYNEPWNCAFWRNPRDLNQRAIAYLTLVKATADYAWRNYDSNVKILIAADTIDTACVGLNGIWRQHLIDADTSGFLKDSRVHPTVHTYSQNSSPDARNIGWGHCYSDFSRYECAYADFKAHGHPNPTVWVTEFGWLSSKVGEATQADFTKKAYIQMQNSGIVDKAYSFMLTPNNNWDYNWLKPDNNCKQICGTIQNYLNP